MATGGLSTYGASYAVGIAQTQAMTQKAVSTESANIEASGSFLICGAPFPA